MKAIVYESYGSAEQLKLTEVERPMPQGNEVQIEIVAASVNAADWRLLRGEPFIMRFSTGLRKPSSPILGSDVAGRVSAVGPDVTRFKIGDAVFGDLSGDGLGGFTEYAIAPEAVLAAMPDGLSFEDAAALPMAGVTAWQGLVKYGKLQAGQHVLINGASGGVGSFAVQIAKAKGAVVSAVCSTSKMELARSLGADHVIDYTREDFTQSDQRYDLIFAVNGDRSISAYQRALTPTGTYVAAGGSMKQIFQAVLLGPMRSKSGGQTLCGYTAEPSATDLAELAELVVAGKVIPVIDRCYDLADTAEGVALVDEGHARGKVIIRVNPSP